MQTVTIDRTKTWTVDDYLLLEEGLLAQLINGELIMSPAPNTLHQRTLWKLNDIISKMGLNGELFFAPIDVHVDLKNVFQPDLVFVKNDQKAIISERGIEGAPALIAEVVSPSNSFLDRNIKKKKYLDFGVKEYWIVDPANRTLEVYATDLDNPILYLAGDGEVKTPVLEGKNFQLELLFTK